MAYGSTYRNLHFFMYKHYTYIYIKKRYTAIISPNIKFIGHTFTFELIHQWHTIFFYTH